MITIDYYTVQLILIAIIYSQVINIFESMVWAGGLWRLKAPFGTCNELPKQDMYHLVLMIAYALPFIPISRLITSWVLPSWIVWLLNDLLWHFWSVNPKYWIDWIKFYFNPKKKYVIWYARMGLFYIGVTPRLMFYITLFRIILLPLIYYISTSIEIAGFFNQLIFSFL